jgi:hypothetical protein
MGQRHVERVNPRHPRIEQDRAFVAPVDLGLRAGDDFEPVVQPVQARRGVVVAGEPLAASATWSLTPLVVPVEAVLGTSRLWITDGATADNGPRTGLPPIRTESIRPPRRRVCGSAAGACYRRQLRHGLDQHS